MPFALGLLAVAAQCWALYSPGSAVPDITGPIPGLDKLVHALLFGIPVWLLLRAGLRRLLVLSLAVLHVIVSEVVQYRWIPGRDGDVWDAVADLTGIGLALWLVTRGAGHTTRAAGPHAAQRSVRAP